jgi:TonB family protein
LLRAGIGTGSQPAAPNSLANTIQDAPRNTSPHDRRYSRWPAKSFAYIDLSGCNDGTLLNISEGGLAVRTTVPLSRRPLPTVRFQLPHSPEWLHARAQVVWTIQEKKEAGIQFIELSEHARKQIRKWVSLQRLRDDSIASTMPEHGSTQSAASCSSTASSASADGFSANARDWAGDSTGENIERNLRRYFEARQALIDSAPSSRQQISWTSVALVGSLAVIAMVLGIAAGRGKLSGLGFLPKATAHASGSAEAAAETSLPVPHAGLSAAHGAERPSPNAKEDKTRGSRVVVTSRLFIPPSSPQHVRALKTNRLRAGQLAQRVDPDYPLEAINAGIEGTVQLRASVTAAGSVRVVSVLGGPELLVPPALKAVRGWRYTPTLLDGKPIETEQDIAIVFWLPPDPPHDQTQ